MFLLKLLRQPTRSILSCRNAGLGDNLLAAANAWLYAKRTGRSLIPCWVVSRYRQDMRENAFWHLFSLAPRIDSVPILKVARVDRLSALFLIYHTYLWPYPDVLCVASDLAQRLAWGVPWRRFRDADRVPAESAADRRTQREERMVVAGIESRRRVFVANGCYSPRPELKPFFDSLTLTEHLAQRVCQFATEHFRGKKVIGVHVRYYDPSLPVSTHTPYWTDSGKGLSACMDKIEQAIARVVPADYVVFLATDSPVVQAEVAARVEGVVTLTKRFGLDGKVELHKELPVETAEDSAVEMFLLAKSDVLVRYPPHSWFSHYASLYAGEVIV
jgi:hypothetical protein